MAHKRKKANKKPSLLASTTKKKVNKKLSLLTKSNGDKKPVFLATTMSTGKKDRG